MNKPLVVFVFTNEGSATSTKYGGFAQRLRKHGGLQNVDVLNVALENLAFRIDAGGKADVIDTASNTSLSTSSFVYLKTWEAMPEEACALGKYLEGRGIPFADELAAQVGVSKLATMMRLWASEIAVPDSLYIRRHDRLVEYIRKTGWQSEEQFILKDIVGSKGKLNFLTTIKNLHTILKKHPNVNFVCQKYIENDGDWRIGVYAHKAAFAIKRKGSPRQSHLNNISAGGEAVYIPVEKVDPKLLKTAILAAQASHLAIAGVDTITDKHTKKSFVLEVNQGSQIVTGAFTEENIAAFNAALEELTPLRLSKTRQKPLKMIGRRALIKLPDLGVSQAVAKIDTGAYSSTLHAENMRLDGEELVFDINPAAGFVTSDNQTQTIRTKDFFTQKVRSSNGQVEQRYSIRTTLVIEGKVIKTVLTLSDRTNMGYPLLVGRRVIRSRFLINVELSERAKKEWKY